MFVKLKTPCMKKIILLSVLFIFNYIKVDAQVKNDTLTNSVIIKMTKSKLGDDLIIKRVNSSPTKFDVSTDGLIQLKDNNVSEKVLNAMISRQEESDKKLTRHKTVTDGSNSLFPESGIYFKKDKDYVPLDATLVTSKNSGGSGCLYIYGIKKKLYMSQIEGSEANYQLGTSPEFYFNFDPGKRGLNQAQSGNFMDGVFGTSQAASPNEFKLIKLDASQGRREYVSGTAKANGETDFSINDKYIVEFKYSKTSSSTYKITFPNGLTPGQYCFVYLANNANTNPYIAQNGNRVFDFSVR
jgi:hypothetical protein